MGNMMLPIVEVAFGLVALILTAMGFTSLSWAQGMSDAVMKEKSRVRARRLFYWCGLFWALTVGTLYLCLIWR